MESVPPSVDLEPAGEIASVLLELEKKEHTLSDVCGKMRELLRKLDNVPPAVDGAEIKGAHRSLDSLVDVETRRDGLERDFERLVRLGRSLNAVPVDCSVDIEETGVLFQSIQSLTNIRENMRVVSDRQTCLIGNTTKALTELVVSTHSLKNCEKELKKYLEENPVCPECGAEQEHWAK